MPVHAPRVVRGIGPSETADVAKVVVDPHYRGGLRDLQPAVVDGKHFLVRNEVHRRILDSRFGEHRELRVEHSPHRSHLLIAGVPSHRRVVCAADANRPENLLLCIAVDGPLPVFVDLALVRRVVPLPLRILVPVDVVAQHRLAVARPDDDPHPVRELHVLWTRNELVSTRMHRGPDDVQPAAEHHLEDLLVALHAQ